MSDAEEKKWLDDTFNRRKKMSDHMETLEKLETAHKIETINQKAKFIDFAAATEKMGIGSETTKGWLWSSISPDGLIIVHTWSKLE